MLRKTNYNLIDTFLEKNELLFTITALFAVLFGIILDINSKPDLADPLLLNCAFFIFILLVIFIGMIIFNGFKLLNQKGIGKTRRMKNSISEIIQQTIIMLILFFTFLILFILGQYFYNHFGAQFTGILEIPIFYIILFALPIIIDLYWKRIISPYRALFYSVILLVLTIVWAQLIINLLEAIDISKNYTFVSPIPTELFIFIALFVVTLISFLLLLWRSYNLW